MIKIVLEFSGKLDEDMKLQAQSAVTMLHGMFGASILPVSALGTHGVRVGGVEIAGTREFVMGEAGNTPTAPKAADGIPFEIGPDGIRRPSSGPGSDVPEPSAAEAFGTPPAPTTGERDTAGTPWDERIHASTKTTNKDGTWTRRRNTPDATFDAVMAEIKGAPPAPTEAASAFPLPPNGDAPTTPAAPAPSPVPAAPSASSTSPAAELRAPAETFPKIMVKITKAQAAKLLSPDDLASILQAGGVEPDANGKISMMYLNKNAHLVPVVDALLTEHLQG